MAPPLGVAGKEILPHCAAPQGWSAQVTPLPAGSLFTVATMLGTVSANETVLAGAVMATAMASTVTVIEVAAAGSAKDVAVIVTGVSALGGAGGAV